MMDEIDVVQELERVAKIQKDLVERVSTIETRLRVLGIEVEDEEEGDWLQ